ncbi:MAG: SEL1-like repeat protein [Desulfobaccales bacterium]
MAIEMPRSIFIIMAALAIVLIICLSEKQGISDDSKEKLVRLGEGYFLSEAEVEVLKNKALGGAPEPAFRLSLFYEFYKRDYKESNFWEVIAAENGHPIAQYNLAARLTDDPDPRNRQRARFWLERAAKSGDKNIVKKVAGKLKKLQQKESEGKQD